MSHYDKIRILWIQDTTDIPSREFPEHFADYFDVVTKSQDGVPWPLVSMDSFKWLLEEFWVDNVTEVLPVEIMAVDYDLSKASATLAISPDKDAPGEDELDEISDQKAATDDQSGESLDFDGLLMGVFYATLTYDHPMGFVPTTYRMPEMTTSVSDFQRLSQRILGIDFSFAGTERTWANIINAGVYNLRRRIEVLYSDKQIVISMDDLMALEKSADYGVITIYCRRAARRLPIQGLFIDEPEERRAEAIHGWVEKLMEIARVKSEELRQANELKKIVWDAYDNHKDDDNPVLERELLSLLDADREANKPYDKANYDRLVRRFGVKGDKCTTGCIDIMHGKYSHRVRRWAILLILLEFFAKVITIKKSYEEHVRQETKEEELRDDIHPSISLNDLYLALFPVPSKPVRFPWHESKKVDKSSGWVRSLNKLHDKLLFNPNYGDIGIHLPDVMNGKELVAEISDPENCPVIQRKYECYDELVCLKHWAQKCSDKCHFGDVLDWKPRESEVKTFLDSSLCTLSENEKKAFFASCLVLKSGGKSSDPICARQEARSCPAKCGAHGPYGLTSSERLVLKGFAFARMSKDDWKLYEKARVFIWGKEPTSE
jgi:hypothetical protein